MFKSKFILSSILLFGIHFVFSAESAQDNKISELKDAVFKKLALSENRIEQLQKLLLEYRFALLINKEKLFLERFNPVNPNDSVATFFISLSIALEAIDNNNEKKTLFTLIDMFIQEFQKKHLIE